METGTGGLRDRKRKELFNRIARTSLTLFIEKGYEATTLDEIANAAGISRRTFFYYFKSKEEVLLAYESSGFATALSPAILAETSARDPLRVARASFIKLAAKYETEEAIVADRLLRATEALRLRKDGLFVQLEQSLAEAFRTRWPDPARHDELRLTAMIAMGALRLALDEWRGEDAARPLAWHLQRAFALLEETLVKRAPEERAAAG